MILAGARQLKVETGASNTSHTVGRTFRYLSLILLGCGFQDGERWLRRGRISLSNQVQIHTDGACLGNPGPGGYGVVLRMGDHERELSGGFRLTTNNRMELLAVIKGLETLTRPCRVVLYSDSRYVVDAMEKGWAVKWRANRWQRNKRERAVNPDLWARLLDLCATHDVEFRWVRGHSGVADNERCDRLAVAAAKQSGLPDDPGYRPNS